MLTIDFPTKIEIEKHVLTETLQDKHSLSGSSAVGRLSGR